MLRCCPQRSSGPFAHLRTRLPRRGDHQSLKLPSFLESRSSKCPSAPLGTELRLSFLRSCVPSAGLLQGANSSTGARCRAPTKQFHRACFQKLHEVKELCSASARWPSTRISASGNTSPSADSPSEAALPRSKPRRSRSRALGGSSRRLRIARSPEGPRRKAQTPRFMAPTDTWMFAFLAGALPFFEASERTFRPRCTDWIFVAASARS